MSNVIFFEPRSAINADQNLNDFISHCRNALTLYEGQGGFKVNKWVYNCGRKKHAMSFSKYNEKNNPYKMDPLDEPFLSFAKAYIRYRQSENQVTSVGDKMVVLRTVHDALINIYGDASVLKVDGIVQSEVYELLNARYSGSPKLFRYGGQLVSFYNFLIDKKISPALPESSNDWKRPKSKAEGTDDESQKWQQERCPSQHQMLALADCFANSKTTQDLYWSSVICLLMFAPSRGGELKQLSVDSLHKEEGRIAVKWFAEKGFGHTLKWVPKHLEASVRLAIQRLLEIGKPARDAAYLAHKSPGVFMRHDNCVTPADFPEDKPLNALQFAHAMGFSKRTIERMEEKLDDYNCTTAWNVLGAHQVKWIQQLRKNGNPTYQKLANYVKSKYQTNSWPNIPKTERPIWESLVLVRENEFHANHGAKPFSWLMPDVNQLNDQLSQRPLKNPIPTIFQRFGIKDEDGSEIEMTSHQPRVWLSTNAERGGMDSWKLAQWAGRSRIEDNRHYDLRTQQEREEQINAVLELDRRPTALQAVKLNLPVSYADLGINRIGVADVTEWGFCVHDYAMSPCTKGGECVTCKEHICMKGMPKTLERLRQLEEQVDSQYQKARSDKENGVFGADRWETHLGWKLAHIRTQRMRMESEDIPDGTLLWIPPEHDPSPIERSLQQRGYEIETHEDELIDELLIDNLLGGS